MGNVIVKNPGQGRLEKKTLHNMGSNTMLTASILFLYESFRVDGCLQNIDVKPLGYLFFRDGSFGKKDSSIFFAAQQLQPFYFIHFFISALAASKPSFQFVTRCCRSIMVFHSKAIWSCFSSSSSLSTIFPLILLFCPYCCNHCIITTEPLVEKEEEYHRDPQ